MGLIQGSTNKEVEYFKEVNGPFSVLRKGCVIQGQEVISTFDVYLGSSLSKIPKWKPQCHLCPPYHKVAHMYSSWCLAF